MKFTEIREILKNQPDVCPFKEENIRNDREITAVFLQDEADRESAPIPGILVVIYKKGTSPERYAGWAGTLTIPLPERDAAARAASLARKIQNILLTRAEENRNSLLARTTEDRYFIDILQALLRGGDPGRIISDVAARYHRSLAVIDLSGKVLYHSEPFEKNIAYMTQNIENGYCSPLFMEHINRIRQRDSEPGTRKSFCSYCEEAGVYYLSCLIYRGSELYGYIFMISLTDFFPPECHDIVEFIARSISDSLSDRSDSEPVDRRLQGNLFFDMLSGISPGQIDARVRMSGMKIPERMTVISIRSDYWQGKDFPKNVILPGIQRIFPDRPAVLFGRDIAVLADAGDLEENIPGETGRSLALQHFCREHHLHAGFSTPFRNITDVKKHYEEAARAARILQKLKTAPAVSPAHATLLYQMMDKLPGETDFSRFEHPALRELEKYDSEHGTQLLPTLFAFARCNFSLSEASAALFIHRNTMIYRKKRIEQIADIRLDDPETRFEIQVSLAIRNFTE